MKNRFFLISISIAVLISLVPLSVFAYSSREYDVIVVPVLEDVAKTQTTRADYSWASRISNNTRQYYNLFRRPSDFEGEVYVFAEKQPNGWRPIFVTTEDRGTTNLNISWSQNYDSNWKSSGSQLYSEDYNLYYNTPNGLFYSTSFGTEQECYLSEYNSINDGLSAIRTGLDNGSIGGGGTVQPKFLSISIQPGTVAYVSVAGGQFTLKTSFEKKFSGGLLSSARYWYATSLPSGRFTVGNGNNIQPIVWRADGPYDMLRRTYNGILEVDNLSSGYYAIYNPIEGVAGNNGVIRAYFSDAISVVQYPLNNTYEGNVLVGEGSDENVYVADNDAIDEYGNVEYMHYDVDEQGNTITSSAISTPVGGLNIIDAEDSSLGGLVDRILYLLSAPIKHIQQLFNSGSDFMNWLGSLWSWLPEPVYVILTSALVVLMVIGVIKFLWK